MEGSSKSPPPALALPGSASALGEGGGQTSEPSPGLHLRGPRCPLHVDLCIHVCM